MTTPPPTAAMVETAREVYERLFRTTETDGARGLRYPAGSEIRDAIANALAAQDAAAADRVHRQWHKAAMMIAICADGSSEDENPTDLPVLVAKRIQQADAAADRARREVAEVVTEAAAWIAGTHGAHAYDAPKPTKWNDDGELEYAPAEHYPAEQCGGCRREARRDALVARLRAALPTPTPEPRS